MEAVNSAFGAFPTALAGGLGLGICATGAAIYRAATRKKPTHVSVNCWFCSQDTTVPYGNRNCWDCPNCEQYNGFQENGDYNKPIPAQYMEHLNHMVTSWATPSQASKIQQWPNGQILFCKKCNNNQPLKIKQLASFVPRDEDKYEEEIEVYKHHLEQTYKLCRPCQTAVEYYIKHQDRQIRAILFDHQLRRREADKTFVQSSHYSSLSTPIRVLFLRFVAFVSCAVLVAMAVYGSGSPFTGQKPPAEMQVVDPMSNSSDETISPSDQRPVQNVTGWEQLLDMVPEEMLMNLQAAWDYGKNHQMAVVTTGLFTCLLAVFLAGRIRLRRIDAVASLLWLTVMSLHLMENYLQTDVPGWLDTLKFSTTSLCCLVGFTATIATRKSTGQRRYRARRYLSGESVNSFCSDGALSPCASSLASSFIPIPPSIPQLARQQLCRTTRRNSPCSLPGRLNRALSLGTIPSLTRTESGYLFSGSRPPSQTTVGKDSPPSDYFSLKSGSRPSSPSMSPTPSVAGSVTSSSGSLHHRRPLISPARLNLTGQRLKLFTEHSRIQQGPLKLAHKAWPAPNLSEDANVSSNVLAQDVTRVSSHSHNAKSVEGGSIYSETTGQRKDSSSRSSACVVDTTTNVVGHQTSDVARGWKGFCENILWTSLLGLSLTANLIFVSVYLYQGLH
ncbi:transmembrane protein 201 isoform X1 [Carcharodon carcharias]|uniref:transmembrane protein 201 isoform X1 n=2 Tax=Carcharodon carcharias TaxID=13397 RepID=UPI001B7EB9BE|nr:transmembrane protein 201 isoform X1 [Carcharodon carcharias]